MPNAEPIPATAAFVALPEHSACLGCAVGAAAGVLDADVEADGVAETDAVLAVACIGLDGSGWTGRATGAALGWLRPAAVQLAAPLLTIL